MDTGSTQRDTTSNKLVKNELPLIILAETEVITRHKGFKKPSLTLAPDQMV